MKITHISLFLLLCINYLNNNFRFTPARDTKSAAYPFSVIFSRTLLWCWLYSILQAPCLTYQHPKFSRTAHSKAYKSTSPPWTPHLHSSSVKGKHQPKKHCTHPSLAHTDSILHHAFHPTQIKNQFNFYVTRTTFQFSRWLCKVNFSMATLQGSLC